MLYPRRRFRGFTLIELLVAIVVIVVLMALLLPAVQRAREAARQVQCKNNLKQLGLALHNYQDIHGVFPPGWVAAYQNRLQPVDHSRRSAWAWGALILPYIEQSALYKKTGGIIVPSYSPIDTFPVQPGDVEDRLVSTFTCSSDPGSSKTGFGNTHNGLNGYSRTNYAPCGGLQHKTNWFYDYYPSHHAFMPSSVCGMFGPGSHTAISDVRDGTNSTIMLGEVTNAKRRNLPVNAAYAINPAPTWIRNVAGSYEPDMSINIDPLAVIRYTRVRAGTKHYPVPINEARFTWGGFSSSHPEGANFCLADASIRFLNEAIDQTLYEKLSTPGGEEIIRDF